MDIEFIGDYDITVTSEFDQSNYLGEVETIRADFTFTLSVLSCVVESYDVLQSIGSPILYTLGDPPVSFGPYAFAQSPDCDYETTVSFENLPTAFIAHNASERQFYIAQTEDLGFLGTHNVALRSEFTQVN